MPSPPAARPPGKPPRKPRKSPIKGRIRQRWTALLRGVRLRPRAGAAWRTLASGPAALRIACVVAVILIALPLANIVYQVIRKPTELLFFVEGTLHKEPPETWRQYGALFREYSTDAITPELLAALAQTESTGNPVARTYWRWRLTWNPFAVYKPASSAVGLFQMTDPAYAEASRHCIRRHAVVDDCWLNSFYIRALPSHATELAAIYLDRQVTGVLASTSNTKASPRQKQDIATLIHLCGAGPARAFARRGFQLAAGERCGDHLASAYLMKVNTMKRRFVRLAAGERDEAKAANQ